MNDETAAIIDKLKAYSIVNDPQWLERLDEPAPLRVVLELIHQVMLRLEPPKQPYD